MDKIEKIRAEIKRLKSTNPSEYNYQNAEGYTWALDDLLSFINSLPEEYVEGLENDEIIDYAHSKFYFDKDFDGYGHGKFRPVFTREDLISFARHYYKLGLNARKKK